MSAKSVVVGIVCLAATIAGALAIGEGIGRHAERSAIEAKARQDSLKHNADTLRLTGALLVAQRETRLAVAQRDSVVRAQRDVARQSVRIVDDSHVAIVATHDSAGAAAVDSVGPTLEIPKEVVTVIRADDVALQQDSITMRAQAAELQTLYRRDTLHVQTERLLQEQLPAAGPQRCGRWCGFAAGAVIAVAVVRPKETAHVAQQVIAGAGWIIRHLH